ncbi:MAG: DUF1217 domain-containing protein [Paracoccaceae bacterium]
MIPTVGPGGIAGLALLDRTYARQLDAFSRSAEVERAVAYFEEKAPTIASAADLVADRRLLGIALGAFGLDDEIDKRALLRRVLEEGAASREALAVRMVDPAYRKLADAFGFDRAGRMHDAEARAGIVDRYRVRRFERAIGNEDVTLRLALNFRREIAELAAAPGTERSGWFSVVGSEPLRRVLFGALGLPQSFAALDLDDQARRLSERAEAVFGARSPRIFADPAVRETAVRRFLANAALDGGISPTSPGAAALTLLGGSAGLGAGAIGGLVASRF